MLFAGPFGGQTTTKFRKINKNPEKAIQHRRQCTLQASASRSLFGIREAPLEKSEHNLVFSRQLPQPVRKLLTKIREAEKKENAASSAVAGGVGNTSITVRSGMKVGARRLVTMNRSAEVIREKQPRIE